MNAPSPALPLRPSPHRWWPSIAALPLGLALALPAQADAVTDWNMLASGPVVAPRFGGPQPQTRALAIVQIAVHDALNSIDPRYRRYAVVPPALAGASPDAAVAAASRRALLQLIAALPAAPSPAEEANRQAAINAINAAFDNQLGPLPYDASEASGIAAGEAAANAILQLRGNDGSATPNTPPYLLGPAPGIHQPTPAPEFPAITVPAFTGWAKVTPFAVNSATQFRSPPGALFNLGGLAYAINYEQVRRLGDARVRGTQPDSELTDIARFWPGGGADWNANARLIAGGLGLDRWQHARMFALVNVATADALITNIESKYLYSFWRPVTAIRWVDDGNPLTRHDPAWRPLLQTPPYPDYPCALPTANAAGASSLARFFGTDDIAFTRTVNAGPLPLPAPLAPLPAKAITRSFDSLTEAENEAARSRVYAGLHFIEGCYAGKRMGNQVARFVHRNYFEPL